MGNLQVYYCPSCGFYGYYDRPNVCLRCSTGMTKLKSYDYEEFREGNSQRQDEMVVQNLLDNNTDLVIPTVTPYGVCNQRETVAKLLVHLRNVEAENAELKSMVEHMRQLTVRKSEQTRLKK